jgi:LysM repeat protein
MTTFRSNENGNRGAVQRHRDAEQRLVSNLDSSSSTTTRSHRQVGSSYPEGSWRKEFDLYVVRRGDTLNSIARDMYGNGDEWPRIQRANPVVLSNPEVVHPGLVLRIPKGAGPQLA